MIIKDDWHIHSEHSCDGACMKIEDLVKGAAKKGIERFGITDHIHTQFNYPDIVNSKKAYEKNRSDNFIFGVEVSCVSKWELDKVKAGATGNLTYGIREGGPAGGDLAIAINEEYIAEHNIKFVVGGTHWPMYVDHSSKALIDDYHRQNMFLSEQKLVNIIAHPWWCLGPCENSWIKDFSMVPKSMHQEFAKSCIENKKLVEINLSAMLLNWRYSDKFIHDYIDYLALLKEYGVKFSIGSDCHNQFYDIDFQKSSDMLEAVGFVSEDLHSPV